MRLDPADPEKTVFEGSMGDPGMALRGRTGASLSGNERNNLFLNRQAQGFEDVSGVSGLDHPADGRALAFLDYDRDGWLDVAVANANTPLFQLFRNQMGDGAPRANVLAVRFVGANRSAGPAAGKSPRDGYGARVELQIGDTLLVREHRAGEGFAAQNSATLLVGLGDAERVDQVRVRWPSGRVQELGPVSGGWLLTAFEDPSETADGSGFATEPYWRPGVAELVAERLQAPLPNERRLALANGSRPRPAKLRLLTTMATWCKTCEGELPQVAQLRRAFAPDELELLAVPIDEDDTREKLERYRDSKQPAYELLIDLDDADVAAVQRVVLDDLRVDALPASVLTDSEGRVLQTLGRVPSVSEIRALLARPGA